MSARSPRVPLYGIETLAEVMPQVGALLTDAPAARAADVFGLRESLGHQRRVCLHVVDGLGAETLAHGAAACPTLATLATHPASRTIRTCIPSTTVTSLASFGTGLVPGEHGLVGYTMYLKGIDTVLNAILFTRHGDSKGGSLAGTVVPEELQAHPTSFEELAAHDVPSYMVSDITYDASPLTRAALRGPKYVGWKNVAETPSLIASCLTASDPALVFSYDPRLDRVGHMAGIASEAFEAVLAETDATVAAIIDSLPAGTCLIVTGDHGMMDVPSTAHIDLADETHLLDDIVGVAGEPRFRHLHTQPGSAPAVAEAWRDRVGDSAWVRLRDEAIAEGWFGPAVGAGTHARIGDVVVAFSAVGCVVQSDVDPLATRLVGHHGSFTPAESDVPLLVYTS